MRAEHFLPGKLKSLRILILKGGTGKMTYILLVNKLKKLEVLNILLAGDVLAYHFYHEHRSKGWN